MKASPVESLERDGFRMAPCPPKFPLPRAPECPLLSRLSRSAGLRRPHCGRKEPSPAARAPPRARRDLPEAKPRREKKKPKRREARHRELRISPSSDRGIGRLFGGAFLCARRPRRSKPARAAPLRRSHRDFARAARRGPDWRRGGSGDCSSLPHDLWLTALGSSTAIIKRKKGVSQRDLRSELINKIHDFSVFCPPSTGRPLPIRLPVAGGSDRRPPAALRQPAPRPGGPPRDGPERARRNSACGPQGIRNRFRNRRPVTVRSRPGPRQADPHRASGLVISDKRSVLPGIASRCG
jgi:hypothetical protein